MNDYINKLLIAQCVVEELKNKKISLHINTFVTVINAMNVEIIKSLKNDTFKSSAKA